MKKLYFYLAFICFAEGYASAVKEEAYELPKSKFSTNKEIYKRARLNPQIFYEDTHKLRKDDDSCHIKDKNGRIIFSFE